MTLQELCDALSPSGWRLQDGSLHAPSVGFWVTEAQLSQPLRLYGAAARRHQDHLSIFGSSRHEFAPLLAALERMPLLQLIGSHVRDAHSLVQRWSFAAHFAVTAWEFSLPLVRLTARHPAGGLACIEIDFESAPTAAIVALHWRDDHSALVRRHWRQHVITEPWADERMLTHLDRARLLLLEARDFHSWPTSPLGRSGSPLPEELSFDEQLPVLA